MRDSSLPRLRTLGRVSLLDAAGTEDRSLATRPRKLALLSWLALRPDGRATRDQTLGVFWAERDEQRARASLSDAVSHLRRALGRDALRTQGVELILDRTRLDVDAIELASAARASDHARVTALYCGPFLDGFYVEDAPDFADWRDRERARFAQLFAVSAAVHCRSLAEAAAWDEMRSIAERWVEIDPSDADAALALLRATVGAGTRASFAAALRLFENLDARVQRDFGEPLDTRVRTYAADLRGQLDILPLSVDEPLPSLSVETAPARPSAAPAGRRWLRVALPAVGIAALGAIALALAHSRSTAGLDRRRVIVEPFVNNTGDTSLARVGDIAADWISRGLSETGRINVLDPAIGETRAAQDPRAIGARTGAGTIVMGTYARVHDSLSIDARIVDARTGKVLRVVDNATAPLGDPIAGIQRLRQRVAAGVAVELDDFVGAMGLGAPQPPTYAAYLEWIEGFDQFMHRHMAVAADHFERAEALDAQFTSSRLWRGVSYCNLGWLARCDSILTSVAERRATMSGLDQLAYDLWVAGLRGDWPRRYVVTTEMARRSPASELANYLAGLAAIEVNRSAEGIDYLSRIDAEHSGGSWDAFGTKLPRAFHTAGRHRDELAEAERRLHHEPTLIAAMEERAVALAALDRPDDALRQAIAMSTTRDPSDILGTAWFEVASELARHGHPSEARALLDRAIAWDRAQPRTSADTVRGMLARSLYEVGSFDEARALADSLVAEQPDKPVYLSMHGLVAARRGDRAEAERVSQELANMRPAYDWGSTTFERARIAAVLGQRDSAVELLRQAKAEGTRIVPIHQALEFRVLDGYAPFSALFRER